MWRSRVRSHQGTHRIARPDRRRGHRPRPHRGDLARGGPIHRAHAHRQRDRPRGRQRAARLARGARRRTLLPRALDPPRRLPLARQRAGLVAHVEHPQLVHRRPAGHGHGPLRVDPRHHRRRDRPPGLAGVGRAEGTDLERLLGRYRPLARRVGGARRHHRHARHLGRPDGAIRPARRRQGAGRPRAACRDHRGHAPRAAL